MSNTFLNSHLFRKKNIVNEETKGELKKTLSLTDLILFGIAAIIGAGIFSTIGKASYDGGVGVSYLIIFVCITCLFCAFCYAEFASRVPNAGSAYSYVYATLGQMPAWIIGWALILEYSFSNSVLTISWASYANNILDGVGLNLPIWLKTNYFAASQEVYNTCPKIFGIPIILNILTFVFNIAFTYVAYIGIKESKWVAHTTVIVKLITIAFVIGLGFFYIKPANWNPVFPNGLSGVFAGTAAIFFAFIGFDAISTTAEECKNPKKDLPKGMIISLFACALIYIVLTIVITGIVNYKHLNVEDPIAFVFKYIQLDNISYIVSISALFVITSAFMVFRIAQPRIWLSMGRDGLLPKKFAQISPKYKTPTFGTIITGILTGVPSLFFDISKIADLTSIGTLFAFICVCAGTFFLPKIIDKNGSTFKTPYVNGQYIINILFIAFNIFYFNEILDNKYNLMCFDIVFLIVAIVVWIKKLSLIPIVGILCCAFLITKLDLTNWFAFGAWLIIGLCIYFLYGYRKTKT